MPNPDTRVCEEHERWKFLILERTLNERSPLATETGKVQNIRKATQTLEKIVSRFFVVMAFNNCNGDEMTSKFAS